VGVTRTLALTALVAAVAVLVLPSLARPWTPPAQPTFADVPPSSAFYTPIEALAATGIMSGYSCGGPGEPCDALNRPYFRQFTNLTRGQLAKLVATAANVDVANPPVAQSFADVPPAHPFYAPVEALAAAGIMSGYSCGGPGEPCGALNRPYFRPYRYVTRAQVAKVVAQTFVFADTPAPTLAVPAPIVVARPGPPAPRPPTS